MRTTKGVPPANKSTTTFGIVVLLACIAMLAFAANSLLTRLAFQTTEIDAATFTTIRLVSGAITLLLIVLAQGRAVRFSAVDWLSAALLFVYAAAFSFAYLDISTGAGALILFASAQLMMISYGVWRGERASILGVLMAFGGLVVFLAPGAAAPPLGAAALMAIAGFAWGGFSLLGKSSNSPVAGTANSFLLAVPFCLILFVAFRGSVQLDGLGILYAILSGSVTSGIGYVIWYWVRVRMTAISAGASQLSVPVISAVLGLLILNEQLTLQGVLAAVVVLVGVGIVTLTAKRTS